MAYPDFAFYTITKVILFFVNCTVTTLSYYWGSNIILQIYQKDVSFKQKFLFSSISAMLLNIIPVYGISYINGFVHHIGHAYIGVFMNFIKIMFPLSYFILHLLGVRILKLSRFKSIKIMHLSYVYYICCSLFLYIAGNSIFPQAEDPRGWNYLSDICMLLSGTFCTYIFYQLVYYSVHKYKLHVNYPDNIIVKSIRCELGKNFGFCCAIYVFVLTGFYYPKLDAIHCIFMLLICLCYIVISILADYLNIYKGKLQNKDGHITALIESIDEFRGVKHDFNNILQTYSGYLVIGDYEKLKLYHQKVLNITVSAETRLDISQRISENPSFFSLLINKIEKSQKNGITFQVALMCRMGDVYIDELDFNRIMSILLDNAIEAAEQTPLKRITLSSQLKPDGSKLFILSNDIVDEMNIDDLFISGYTTKLGHMGQGLAQIRSILHKYGNSIFDLTSYKGNFIVYLELRPICHKY